MATYTGTADASGNFDIDFGGNSYASAQKVTVTAEKDAATKTIELFAPSDTTGGGVIQFSGTLDNFPENIGIVTISDQLDNIGNYAFSAFNNMNNMWKRATGLVIEGNVTSIGTGSFQSWQAMKTLQLPDSLISIGDSSFYECNNLESVSFPSSLLTIGPNAFAYCQKLLALVIPDSVTTIGNYAFRLINSATTITIGYSVTQIGSNAFINATSCNEMIVKPLLPPTITSTTFSGLKSACVIKVPAASLTAYQTASNWSAHASKMVGV